MKTDKRTSLMDGGFLTFIAASLKGISQVILIENAITGLLILIAITIESYYLGIIALLSAIIGTLVAKFGGADEHTINQGLLGYNSVLTGMALVIILKWSLYVDHCFSWIRHSCHFYINNVCILCKKQKFPFLHFPLYVDMVYASIFLQIEK